MSSASPCVSCGACCAHFRVSFFWGECQSAGGTVPDDRVEQITPSRVAMKGTCQPGARCEALHGVIGEAVSCDMYALRAATCREFEASWFDGAHNPACDSARAAHGLPPLTPEMFVLAS